MAVLPPANALAAASPPVDPPAANPLRPAAGAPIADRPEAPSESSAPPPSAPPPEAAAPAAPKPTPDAEPSPKQGSELILREPGQQANLPGQGGPAPAAPKSPPAGRPRPSNHSTAPFDPVKVNGKIFEDWSQPQVALVITGRQEGYLEPCGCAGIDTMKGGMSRRHTFFEWLRKEKQWRGGGKGCPVVAVDVGDIAKGFGQQAEQKFQTAVDGMRAMGYDAITLGGDDLRLPAGTVTSVTAGVPGQPSPFVSANVGLFGFAAKMLAPYRIVEAGGKKFAITGVLGLSCQKEIHNNEIEMSDPETALKQIVPEMKAEGRLPDPALQRHARRIDRVGQEVSRVRPRGHRRRRRGTAGPAPVAEQRQDAPGGSGRKGRARRRPGLLRRGETAAALPARCRWIHASPPPRP